MPPAMDLHLINEIGRELHPVQTGNHLMSEDEICPWTLFLTMALTLLKGVLPHVPKMLPIMVQDPEVRRRAEETFLSEDFQNNIEKYFVENIKTDIQAPLNRQIIKSSETVKYGLDLMNGLMNTFLGGSGTTTKTHNDNDLGQTDNMPRYNTDDSGLFNAEVLGQVFRFAKTMYDLS